MKRDCHFQLFWAFIFVGLSGSLTDAQAMGTEESLEANDLFVTVDSRWAGGGRGGYYPVRILVENQGEDCSLTFRFKPYPSQKIPTVERKNIAVATGGKAFTTLSIPMVGAGNAGVLEVERDGELLDAFTVQLTFPRRKYNFGRPGVLSIGTPSTLSTDMMISGLQDALRGVEGRFNLDYQDLEPVMLPRSWVDYTGLDIVMIPKDTLASLDADTRGAILKWAQTGGTLVVLATGPVVIETGKGVQTAPEIERLLKIPSGNLWSPRVFGIPDVRFPSGYFQMDYHFGAIHAFPHMPLPGTREEWKIWMMNTPYTSRSWELRHGVFPRGNNDDFYTFLIPGVTSVPVYAFLILMTIFTIVIGPFNYIFLRRRKRTYLLLLTIPVIAFVTSLTLFLYSTFAYGFDVSSRCRSLTVLDQRTKTAVDVSRLSLFAGIAPSEGLKFPTDTAVLPIWPSRQLGRARFETGFESGTVVWGDQQVLEEGWLKARTRTQFLTIQHRTERGRLEIADSSEEQMTISNGLEWDIVRIIWVDENGNVYQGETLPAGRSGELERIEEARLSRLGAFSNVIRQHRPELPADLEVEGEKETSAPPTENPEVPKSGFLETAIQQFEQLSASTELNDVYQILPRRTYVAILANNPGVEFGIEDTDERAGFHVLYGMY